MGRAAQHRDQPRFPDPVHHRGLPLIVRQIGARRAQLRQSLARFSDRQERPEVVKTHRQRLFHPKWLIDRHAGDPHAFLQLVPVVQERAEKQDRRPRIALSRYIGARLRHAPRAREHRIHRGDHEHDRRAKQRAAQPERKDQRQPDHDDKDAEHDVNAGMSSLRHPGGALRHGAGLNTRPERIHCLDDFTERAVECWRSLVQLFGLDEIGLSAGRRNRQSAPRRDDEIYDNRREGHHAESDGERDAHKQKQNDDEKPAEYDRNDQQRMDRKSVRNTER